MKVIPFIFYKRECPSCANTNSIVFTDFNNIEYDKISQVPDGVYNAKCNNCNKEFIIIWDRDKGPGITDKESSIEYFEKEFIDNPKQDINSILFENI